MSESSVVPPGLESWNVVFEGENAVEVRLEPVPEVGRELPPGHLLLRAERSLVSIGTELTCLTRRFEPGSHWDRWVRYPFYPGYSTAGRVVAVAPEVEGYQPGDRVVCDSEHRQYRVVAAPRVMPVPEAVQEEEATWFALSGVVQNAVREARHALGDAVVVVGLGPLGQLAVQYARSSGAREVIAVDTAPARLELALAHGATAALAVPASEARNAVADLTGGRLADVVYDVTGHPAAFPGALSLARRFGTVVLLGDAGAPSEQRLTSDVITRGLRIVGTHGGHPPLEATEREPWTKGAMARLFFTLLGRGQMRVADLVTRRASPLEAAEVYRELVADRSRAMGVVFDWSGLP